MRHGYIVFWPHRLYFNYVVCHDYIVFWLHWLYVDFSSQLVSTRKLLESGFHAHNN
jgi:hypothetical protein